MQAIIFDLDGTLWDTVSLCTRSWNEAIEARGVSRPPLGDADLAGIMGLTREETRAKLFSALPIELGDSLLELCFQREIFHLLREGGKLYPSVVDGLKRLSQHFSISLVSNCDVPYLDAFFSTTGLQSLFTDWECHGNTGQDKGANVTAVCQRQNFRTAAYVGDTLGDERAARKAKLEFWHVTYGFGTAASPDRSFTSFDALTQLALTLR